MPQMAIKGQVVTGFLADHPVSGSSKLYDDLSDEIAEVYMTDISPEEQVWQLFFNDTSRTGPRGNIIVGVGVVLVSPYNYVIPPAFLLTEPCSNNVAEYNGGIQLEGVKHLEAYNDSKLIVNQVRGEYEV